MISRDDILQIQELLGPKLLPIGTILIFASPTPPENFLECNGNWIRKDEYHELYSIIGGTFGDDEELFCLPDLRGKFVRGYDSSNNLDPERLFGDYQEDAFQGHTHKTDWNGKETNGNGTHDHSLYGDSRPVNPGDSNNTKGGYLSSTYKDFTSGNRTSYEGWHTHSLPSIVLGDVCSSKYGKIKITTETRPKNIALTFCIKAK